MVGKDSYLLTSELGTSEHRVFQIVSIASDTIHFLKVFGGLVCMFWISGDRTISCGFQNKSRFCIIAGSFRFSLVFKLSAGHCLSQVVAGSQSHLYNNEMR